MLKENEVYNFRVEDYNYDGGGVCKYDKSVIFVDDVLKGEFVNIKITNVNNKKNIAFGELIKVIEPSEMRTEKICPHTTCNGCQLMHVNYSDQLLIKKSIVEGVMKHIGRLENIEINNTIGMENPLNYRNKASVPFAKKDKVIEAGFYEKNTHNIVNFDKCMIHPNALTEILQTVKNWILKYEIPVFDEKTLQGKIKHVIVRFGDDEIMVGIISKSKKISDPKKLIQMLRECNKKITSVVLSVNALDNNVIIDDKSENIVLYGKETIVSSIGEYKFNVSVDSFFQVNKTQTEVLYKTALGFLGLKGHETVIDAYCGVGSISLFISKHCKKVIGIESNKKAVNDGRKNITLNKVTNVELIEGACEDEFDKIKEKIDAIIIDPPRKGCDKRFLHSMIKASPDKIVYISCNPSTLARDLNYINENGYKVKTIQPVDMFPYTYHIENVVLIEKK